MKKCGAIIVAAGVGRRMNSNKNKVFLPLKNVPLLAKTLTAFQNCNKIGGIVVVTRDCDFDEVLKIKADYNISKLIKVTMGGNERQESVLNGLEALGNDFDFVAIHDGARCLVSETDILSCIADAEKYGAAALGVPAKDSIKKIDELGFIECDIDRKTAINIQTPQVFKYDEILSAHKQAREQSLTVTDDTALYSFFGKKVFVTIGSYENIKITTREDIDLAQLILNRGETAKGAENK